MEKQTVTLRINNVGSEKPAGRFPYQTTLQEVPLFKYALMRFIPASAVTFAIIYTIFGDQLHVLTGLTVASGMITAIVVPFGLLVTSLSSDGRAKNGRAYSGMEMILGEAKQIFATLRTIPDALIRHDCVEAFRQFVRAIYCMAAEQVPNVEKNGDTVEADSYLSVELFRQHFLDVITEKKIEPAMGINSSNGPLHRMSIGMEAVENAVKVPIRRSMYIVVILVLMQSYITLVALVIANAGGIHWFFTGAFCTAFGYAMGLSILVAHNQALPYGNNKAEINLDERFRRLEDANDVIMQMKDASQK